MSKGPVIQYQTIAGHCILRSCFAMALTMNVSFALAQSGNVTNKIDAYVAPGTIVSIVDSFSNEAAGTMTNEGHIYIKGDWTNIGTYTSNAGVVSFWGSTLQKIKGSASTHFFDAEIDNASGVNLEQQIYVNGTLGLTSGLLTTGSNEAYVVNSAVGAIFPFSASSYVVGNLRREVSGSGSYDFPLGTSSNYELANLSLTGATGFSNILGSFTHAIPNPTPLTTGLNANGHPLNTMLDYGYWTLTPNSAMSGGVYTVTLNEIGAGNQVSTPNVYAVIKRPDSGSAWVSVGTHYDETQSVNGNIVTAARSDLSSFSDFGIGFGNILLPVELLSFTAALNENVVDLDWTTASESNSDFFTLERSGDASNFTFLTNVKGAGTSTGRLDYHRVDEHPLQGTSYYRLKQTDLDGSFRYSQIEPISINGANVDVAVIPNPTTLDNLNLSVIGMGNKVARVSVVDALGRTCFVENITPGSDNYTFRIGVPADLAPGYYTVEVSCGDGTYLKKAVLQ